MRPLTDGDHTMGLKEEPVIKKVKYSDAKYPAKKKGSCQVCKASGKKLEDKKGTIPQTPTWCSRCRGFVHGRNTTGYPSCWDFHLQNEVDGLGHSGEMKQ